MKKILYIMHIDWDWIKQRPQNIALNLNKYYEMLICYPFSPKRWKMVKNSREDISFKPFFPIPFYINEGIIYKLHKAYLKNYINNLIKKYDPDYIWITFPLLYNYVPCNLRSKIIYDCMDDALGFTGDKNKKSRLLKMEKKLIEDSWKIFTSSENLASKLNKRKECLDKTTIIKNSFGGDIINESTKDGKKKDKYKIGYIGTISSWVDFEILQFTLKHFNNIEYHIIGPMDMDPKINKNLKTKFKFYGPINHENLYDFVKNYDCLIMPFQLNELIYSADPVKLYDYLNFNKPIISVYYNELDQFEPYIFFYSDKEELTSLLKEMTVNGFKRKYSQEERLKFLKRNTWEKKVKKIVKIIDKDESK